MAGSPGVALPLPVTDFVQRHRNLLLIHLPVDLFFS